MAESMGRFADATLTDIEAGVPHYEQLTDSTWRFNDGQGHEAQVSATPRIRDNFYTANVIARVNGVQPNHNRSTTPPSAFVSVDVDGINIPPETPQEQAELEGWVLHTATLALAAVARRPQIDFEPQVREDTREETLLTPQQAL